MIKPKKWLFDNGHIDNPNQRGRLSTAHKVLIETAVRNGALIEGFAVSTAEPKAIDEPVAVDRVSTDPNAIVSIMAISRDETMTKANVSTGPVGMRTVCTDCGVSLTHCPCAFPKVINTKGDAETVIFTRLTKPVVVNRFW